MLLLPELLLRPLFWDVEVDGEVVVVAAAGMVVVVTNVVVVVKELLFVCLQDEGALRY